MVWEVQPKKVIVLWAKKIIFFMMIFLSITEHVKFCEKLARLCVKAKYF